MNYSSFFSTNMLRVFYLRYKEYIIPAVIIVMTIFLFIRIIPSQINFILALRQAAQSSKKRIRILSNNVTLLSKVQDDLLDERFLLSTNALPEEKKFDELFQAVSDVAARALVTVDDYGLNVDDDLKNQTDTNSIKIGLTIRGEGIEGVQKFLKILAITLPLSEVESIQINAGSATLVVNFFYKPFVLSVFNKNTPIANLEKTDEETLGELSSWKEATPSSF